MDDIISNDGSGLVAGRKEGDEDFSGSVELESALVNRVFWLKAAGFGGRSNCGFMGINLVNNKKVYEFKPVGGMDIAAVFIVGQFCYNIEY